jgi:hypothetical protein
MLVPLPALFLEPFLEATLPRLPVLFPSEMQLYFEEHVVFEIFLFGDEVCHLQCVPLFLVRHSFLDVRFHLPGSSFVLSRLLDYSFVTALDVIPLSSHVAAIQAVHLRQASLIPSAFELSAAFLDREP